MQLKFRRSRYRYQKYLKELAEKKQTRVYSGFVLTLFTISFFTLFALRPTLLIITELIGEIKQKEETVENLNNNIHQLSSAQASYSKVASRLHLVSEALPTELDFSPLLENLEMAPDQNQISYSGLSFGKINVEGKEEGLQKIDFKTAVGGQFRELKGFLRDIFSLRRIIQSSTFSLVKSADRRKESLVLSVQMTSFYQAREKESKK